MTAHQGVLPVVTAHLFPILDAHLLSFLRSLQPADWNRPTLARQWTVKDVAAHLLDGNIRTLSLARDRHVLSPSQQISDYQSLVAYLNELNRQWVLASRRMSPVVLLDLLEHTGPAVCEHYARLDPFDTALFPVSWAGETTSANWFHIAREYTEKYHHQQQIRHALGNRELICRDLFPPFVATLLRGLPHTFRDIAAAPGTTIAIVISGEAGGCWTLTASATGWHLNEEQLPLPTSRIELSPDTAWQLFTRAIRPEQAEATITGNKTLAAQVLQLVAVMA